MNTADKNFWEASKLSFKWRAKNRKEQVSDSAVTRIGLGGMQPFGVSSFALPDGSDLVVIPNYSGPSWSLNRVEVKDGMMHFDVAWVNGAMNGITSWRGGLPPDAVAQARGANRAVSGFMAPDGGSLCVGRIDRGYYLLAPRADGKWEVKAYLALPELLEFPCVHSVTLYDDALLTVESNADCSVWRMAKYEWGGATDWLASPPVFKENWHVATPRFHYGGILWDGKPMLVTGTHAVKGENAVAPGIYVGSRLLVPGIVGSGLCRIHAGLIVTHYGWEEECPHLGDPGALSFIPNSLLGE